jgi:DNA-binding MarR family transcriptional regulator
MLPMAEVRRRRRSKRPTTAAASAVATGVTRVDTDFTDEYPDGDPVAAELLSTLVRLGRAIDGEIDRAMEASIGYPQSILNTLAVIDGSAEPLTPSEISERALRSSATMTSILDTLERRDWVRRIPNPQDRRSVLIEISDDGRAVADQFLPGIRKIERAVLGDLSGAERATLMKLLAKVLDATAHVNAADPIPLEGRRNRPTRLP